MSIFRQRKSTIKYSFNKTLYKCTFCIPKSVTTFDNALCAVIMAEYPTQVSYHSVRKINTLFTEVGIELTFRLLGLYGFNLSNPSRTMNGSTITTTLPAPSTRVYVEKSCSRKRMAFCLSTTVSFSVS